MGYPTGHHGIVQESPVARLRRPTRYAMAGWPCRCGRRIPGPDALAANGTICACGRVYTMLGKR